MHRKSQVEGRCGVDRNGKDLSPFTNVEGVPLSVIARGVKDELS